MRTTATTCACEGIGYDVKNVMSIDEPQRLCVDLSVCLRRTGAWIRAILNASRRYGHLPSRRERTQRLVQIERAISRGDSIKSAVGQAGISEQTYYQRKKAAAPAPESDALKDLVALEEENKRLKKMLAEHLRKENAELKSRLGLA